MTNSSGCTMINLYAMEYFLIILYLINNITYRISHAHDTMGSTGITADSSLYQGLPIKKFSNRVAYSRETLLRYRTRKLSMDYADKHNLLSKMKAEGLLQFRGGRGGGV